MFSSHLLKQTRYKNKLNKIKKLKDYGELHNLFLHQNFN